MSNETTIMIPPGFRFRPTDQQLITSYLLRMAMGLPILPWNRILEKDVYGKNADPWVVFSDINDSHWEIHVKESKKIINREIYVFTKLSKVNAEKTRIKRRAGCGTWNGQATRKIYNESRKLIGFMKTFTYEVMKAGLDDDTRQEINDDHWIMHEYSLAGIPLEHELKYKDYVICKITRISKVNEQPKTMSSIGPEQEYSIPPRPPVVLDESIDDFLASQRLVCSNGFTQDDCDILRYLGWSV
ncbi:hypothetical protein DH2020_018947 [Rehmannia glutinosa]|uniref:NAC domain-containing protein n=1 Tax=Rehmannia glutinosa TaxID=99300 RepID=A0ABR0WPS3_REHGL